MQKIMSAYYGSKTANGEYNKDNKEKLQSISEDIYNMSSHNNFIANLFEFKGIKGTVKDRG
jgi:hypothetical protein